MSAEHPAKITAWHKLGAQASKARVTFLPAIRTVWPYMLFGFLAALVQLTVSMLFSEWGPKYFKPEAVAFVEKLMEHLAAGFVVSTLAVFLYEWGSEAKELIEIAARLTHVVDDVL